MHSTKPGQSTYFPLKQSSHCIKKTIKNIYTLSRKGLSSTNAGEQRLRARSTMASKAKMVSAHARRRAATARLKCHSSPCTETTRAALPPCHRAIARNVNITFFKKSVQRNSVTASVVKLKKSSTGPCAWISSASQDLRYSIHKFQICRGHDSRVLKHFNEHSPGKYKSRQ